METSVKIWNAIVTLYDNKTTSKLIFYRRSLHSQRKGELSIKEFLMKVKTCCDNLDSCGEVISEHEHVIMILNGLSPKYESVITIVTVVSCEVSSSANMVSNQSPESTVDNGSIP
ncbi:hypothetical protein Golob_022123, partial [Gossypium lobatum]|nr:hypothetical protein [Gossypium lobatum]